ncbi:hypothetical protein FRC12_020673 [Ceratobasidium sp. 428]|nr:hypothetical protein FRC12_020673 [Ceratobasidium sp. 428]
MILPQPCNNSTPEIISNQLPYKNYEDELIVRNAIAKGEHPGSIDSGEGATSGGEFSSISSILKSCWEPLPSIRPQVSDMQQDVEAVLVSGEAINQDATIFYTCTSGNSSSATTSVLSAAVHHEESKMEAGEGGGAALRASRQPPSTPIQSPPTSIACDNSSAIHTSSRNAASLNQQGEDADITSVMSFEGIIPHLSRRGCRDLADEMDSTSYSNKPLHNGGLGDVYKGKLKNGTEVAIKTIRSTNGSDEAVEKHLKVSEQPSF